jgi:hypothetical protein
MFEEVREAKAGPQQVVRGHRRGGAWTPVTYGVHRASAPEEITDEEHPPYWLERDLAGWQLLMTDEGCFTALTALEVWGIDLPPLPEGCPVFMAQRKTDPRPMRAGVHTSRHEPPVPFVVVRGLRVATVAEALVASARWVGRLDLIALIDNALYRELVDVDDLVEISRSRRPGARALREALELVDGRAESLPESLLRVLHVVSGIDVEPQWTVERDGVEVARVDLWVCGTDAAHEYDGDEHEKAPRRVKDLRRLRRLDEAHAVRRGYTLGDLVHRPVAILRDADRAVGRAHDPSRIRTWTELLKESLYTPAGRASFLKRIPVAAPRQKRTGLRKVAADCS